MPVEQVAGSTQADILVTMSVLVLSPVWLAVFAWVASFPERLVLVILVVLAAYVGAGAVGLWALRCVGRELGTLGTMVGRVLPVMTLTTLFMFFNAEVWQVVRDLSMGRTWLLVLVVNGLGLVFALFVSRDVLGDLQDRFARAEPGAPRLRPGERINVLVLGFVVTLVQNVLLAAVVFCFFIGIGWLAVPDATATAWMGSAPVSFTGTWSVLPVSQSLVQVSIIMAAVSGLNFTAVSTSDATYRRTFVDPAFEEVEEALRVRHSYLATGRDDNPGAPDNPDNMAENSAS